MAFGDPTPARPVRGNADPAREQQMTSLIVRECLRNIAGRFGGLPRNYAVIDLETTGFGREDLIVQIGHTAVEDCKITDRMCFYLDWTRHPGTDQEWLRNRLVQVKRAVEVDEHGEPTGRHYAPTYSALIGGAEPLGTLAEYHQLLLAWRENNFGLVAHNGYRLEETFLTNHFQRFLNLAYVFGDNELWDTSSIEKASQVNMLPQPGDTLRDFCCRVSARRFKGVYHALDRVVVPKYGFDKLHGVNPDLMHDAGYDAWVTHLLFEKYRELIAEPTSPF